MSEHVTSRCCYYKIPRKKKYCVIIYSRQIFQCFNDLHTYLKEVDNFSDAVAATVLDTVVAHRVDKLEIIDALLALGRTKGEINNYLNGTIVK